jgi:hypothetical protein
MTHNRAIFYVEGRPGPDQPVQRWMDASGRAAAIFLAIDGAQKAAQAALNAGWCDLKVYTFVTKLPEDGHVVVMTSGPRKDLPNISDPIKPAQHPLAKGIQLPSEQPAAQPEPRDETLRRLDAFRAQIAGQNGWQPHNCYLSPSEQLIAGTLIASLDFDITL